MPSLVGSEMCIRDRPYTYAVADTVAGSDVAHIIHVTASPAGAETDRALDGTAPAYHVQSFHSYPNNVLAYDHGRPAGSSYNHRPRGSFRILRIYAGGLDAPRAIAANDTTVFVQFQTFEPLFVSPFIWGGP